VTFDIARQPLRAALKQFAAQTGLEVMLREEDVQASRETAESVKGKMAPTEALGRLLDKTNLHYEFVTERMVRISSDKPASNADLPPQAAGDGGEDSNRDSQRLLGEQQASFWNRLHLAQADQTTSANPTAIGGVNAQKNSNELVKLEEVIVTAQKKEERLRDVPVSITVLNPEALAENGQGRLAEYFSTVPGLGLEGNAFGGGTQFLTIRGLSTGDAQNATVAVVIDDVPIGSSLQLAFGHLYPPDLDPSDLARIEVLKGPQGTLYGAESLGGLIKYVTADPSTKAFTGRVEVDGSTVLDGGSGYGVRGSVNIPLAETLALRASAFTRRDPGYVDNITTGENNANSVTVNGGHVSALWQPLENISLKLNGLIQRTEGNETGYINSNVAEQFVLGDLKQTDIPGSGRYSTEYQLYSATLKAELFGVSVNSVTGYNSNTLHNYQDNTGFAEAFYSVPSVVEDEKYHTNKFTQEIRFSSSVGTRLDWLVGGFFTHENSNGSYQNTYSTDIATGQFEGSPVFAAVYSPLTLSEYAAFGDLTVHLTDRFQVQFGGRESWNKITYNFTYTGPSVVDFYQVSPPYAGPGEHANGTAFTYLVTPQFKISPDVMAYARFASGYRIGGPNLTTGTGVAASIPSSYKPDTTNNYELGIKGDLFDHRLTLDAAAYYIAWKDFQISESTACCFFECNAGSAKSEGLEFSAQVKPSRGLTITAEGSFDNAVLTQDMPPEVVATGTFGSAGDRLPYSARWSAGLTANQDFPLARTWSGFIGGSVNYVGSREGAFATSGFFGGPRLLFPAYTKVNLDAGVRNGSWQVNLYVNNVGNERGILGMFRSFAYGVDNYSATIIQPRTVGLSIVKNL